MNNSTLSTRTINTLALAGITTMKELIGKPTKELMDIQGLGKKAMLQIMKAKAEHNKVTKSLKVPKKVYKKAVKALVAEQFTDKTISMIHKMMVKEYKAYETTMSRLVDSDAIKKLNYTTFKQFAKHQEPKRGAGKDAFATYRLCERIVHLQVAQDVLKGVLARPTYIADMKALMVSLADVFGKNARKEEVIINSVIPRVQTIFEVSVEGALVMLEMLMKTNLFTRKLITTSDGARDFMIGSNIDFSELKELWAMSSDRVVQLTKPESVRERCLVNRSKIQYTQESNEEVSEALDYILGTEQELILPRDNVIDMVSLKLYGEIGGEFKEDWQKLELKHALAEYDYIMQNGGKFFVDATTDSIYRIYCKSNNFSVQQGHWLRQYIEFADKEALNESGIKWIKLVIAGQNGYDKLTEEEALEAFHKFHDKWQKNGKSDREFEILHNPHVATGYQVELDAQSQSFQLYGLGSASLDTLEGTGYGKDRKDFRTDTAEVMNHLTGVSIWNKDNLKSCVMNRAYTAGKNTVMWGKQSTATEHLTLVESKRQIPLMSTVLAYNKGKKADERLAEDGVWESFSKALEATAYDSVQIMNSMQSVLKDNTESNMKWTMPDGAVCEVIFQDNEKKHFKWVSSKGEMHTVTHSISYINVGKAYNSIPPRIIQGVDSYFVRRMSKLMKSIGAPFVAVHDGYITHPNYVEQMIEFYKVISLEVVETNLLSELFYDATGVYIDFQSNNKSDMEAVIELIKNSRYGLWL